MSETPPSGSIRPGETEEEFIDRIADESFKGPPAPLPAESASKRAGRASRVPARPDAARSSAPPAGLTTAELLAAIVGYVTSYVVLTGEQATSVALWVLHTYTIDALGITPYIWITSAEKSSGKTTLLETLEQVVARPWLTGSVTAAVLARKIDKHRPTLLLDESDAAFKSDKEYAEALRGVLNTGFKAGGTFSRCSGASYEVVDFSTFCPKAIAGIGTLPDTVTSRSIPIRLRRKTTAEQVQRFRYRQVEAAGSSLRAEIQQWAETNLESLSKTDLDPLDGLSDRAFDVWEPLLGIAGLASAEWPEQARRAAYALSGSSIQEDDSIGVRLLADIRALIGDSDRIYSPTSSWASTRSKSLPGAAGTKAPESATEKSQST